jgi:hypothetical protein
MNTVRVSPEAIVVRRGPIGENARALALSVVLCAAVLVCGFLIGRAERPAGTAAEKPPPSLPASSAGAAIPLALGGAATLERVAVVNALVAAKAPSTQAAATTTARAAQEAAAAGSTGTAPAITAPLKATPVATSPAKIAPATPTSSSGRSSTGATNTTSSGAGAGAQRPPAKAESSSGTSFDSSG